MSRTLIVDQRAYEMLTDAVAASVEQFEQAGKMPGLTCEVRQIMQKARDEYRRLLHVMQAGQLDEGHKGSLAL